MPRRTTQPDGTPFPVVHLARDSSEPFNRMGQPVCGGPNRNGGTCGNFQGKGTNHPGVGRCFLHGGMEQSTNQLLRKQGIGTAIAYPEVKEEFDRLKENRDVFDLREHIYLLEAIAMVVLKNAKSHHDLPMVSKLTRDAVKTIKELDEIEHGRRLVIEIPEVRLLFAQVKEVIFRHVPDSRTRELVARDISEIYPEGSSGTDQPRPEYRLVESGVAVESGSGFGTEDEI